MLIAPCEIGNDRPASIKKQYRAPSCICHLFCFRWRWLLSSAATHAHSGDWLFDGTNLKRRYTLIDGRLPSAPTFPYAAFEFRFESRNVFIGTDNIRKRQVRYQRVADGTLP